MSFYFLTKTAIQVFSPRYNLYHRCFPLMATRSLTRGGKATKEFSNQTEVLVPIPTCSGTAQKLLRGTLAPHGAESCCEHCQLAEPAAWATGLGELWICPILPSLRPHGLLVEILILTLIAHAVPLPW